HRQSHKRKPLVSWALCGLCSLCGYSPYLSEGKESQDSHRQGCSPARRPTAVQAAISRRPEGRCACAENGPEPAHQQMMGATHSYVLQRAFIFEDMRRHAAESWGLGKRLYCNL